MNTFGATFKWITFLILLVLLFRKSLQSTGFFKPNTLTRYVYTTELNHDYLEQVVGRPVTINIQGGCELIFVAFDNPSLVKLKMKNCLFKKNSSIPNTSSSNENQALLTELSESLQKNYVWFDVKYREVHYALPEEPGVLNFKKSIISNFIIEPSGVDNLTSKDWTLEDVKGTCITRYSRLCNERDAPKIRSDEYFENFNMSKYLKTCQNNVASWKSQPKSPLSLDKLEMTKNGFVGQRMKCQYKIALDQNRNRDRIQSIICDESYSTELLADVLYIKTKIEFIDKSEYKRVSRPDEQSQMTQISGPVVSHVPSMVPANLHKSSIRFTSTQDITYEPLWYRKHTDITEITNILLSSIDSKEYDILKIKLSELFDDFLHVLRNISDANIFESTTHKIQSSSKKKSILTFYLDGLTQCATHQCIEELTRIITSRGHDKSMDYYFRQSIQRAGLITNPNKEMLNSILNLCKHDPCPHCILTLGSLVNYYYTSYRGIADKETHNQPSQADPILSQSLQYIAQFLNHNCSMQNNQFYSQTNLREKGRNDKIIYQLAALKAITNMRETFKYITGSNQIISNLIGCALDHENAYLVKIAATEALYDAPKSANARKILLAIFKDQRDVGSKSGTKVPHFPNAQRWTAFLHLITHPEVYNDLMSIWQTEPSGSQIKTLMSSYFKDVIGDRQPFYSDFNTEFKLRIEEKLVKLSQLPDMSDKIPFFHSRTYSEKVPIYLPYFGPITIHLLSHVIFERSSFLPQYTVSYVIVQYGTEFYPTLEIGFHGTGKILKNFIASLAKKSSGPSKQESNKQSDLLSLMLDRLCKEIGKAVSNLYPDLNLDFSKVGSILKSAATKFDKSIIQRIIQIHKENFADNPNTLKDASELHEPAILSFKILGKEVSMIQLDESSFDGKTQFRSMFQDLEKAMKDQILRAYNTLESRTVIPTYSGFSHHLAIDRIAVIRNILHPHSSTRTTSHVSILPELGFSGRVVAQSSIVAPHTLIGLRKNMNVDGRLNVNIEVTKKRSVISLKLHEPTKNYSSAFIYKEQRFYTEGLHSLKQLSPVLSNTNTDLGCITRKSQDQIKTSTNGLIASNETVTIDIFPPDNIDLIGFKFCRAAKRVEISRKSTGGLNYNNIRETEIQFTTLVLASSKPKWHEITLETNHFETPLPKHAKTELFYAKGNDKIIRINLECIEKNSDDVEGRGTLTFKNFKYADMNYTRTNESGKQPHCKETFNFRINFSKNSFANFEQQSVIRGSAPNWFINDHNYSNKLTIRINDRLIFTTVDALILIKSQLSNLYSLTESNVTNGNLSLEGNMGYGFDLTYKNTISNEDLKFFVNGSHYSPNDKTPFWFKFDQLKIDRYLELLKKADSSSKEVLTFQSDRDADSSKYITTTEFDYNDSNVKILFTDETLLTFYAAAVEQHLVIVLPWLSFRQIAADLKCNIDSKDGIHRILALDTLSTPLNVDANLKIQPLGYTFDARYEVSNESISFKYDRKPVPTPIFSNIVELLGQDEIVLSVSHPKSSYSATHTSKYMKLDQKGTWDTTTNDLLFQSSFTAFKVPPPLDTVNAQLMTFMLGQHNVANLPNPQANVPQNKEKQVNLDFKIEKLGKHVTISAICEYPNFEWSQNMSAVVNRKFKLREDATIVFKEEPIDVIKVHTNFEGKSGKKIETITSLGKFDIDIKLIDSDKTIYWDWNYVPNVGQIGKQKNYFKVAIIEPYGLEVDYNMNREIYDIVYAFEKDFYRRLGLLLSQGSISLLESSISATTHEFPEYRLYLEIIGAYVKVVGLYLPMLQKISIPNTVPISQSSWMEKGFLTRKAWKLYKYYRFDNPEFYFEVDNTNLNPDSIRESLVAIPFKPQSPRKRFTYWHPFDWNKFTSWPKKLNKDKLFQFAKTFNDVHGTGDDLGGLYIDGGDIVSNVLPKQIWRPRYAYKTGILYGDGNYYVTFDGSHNRINRTHKIDHMGNRCDSNDPNQLLVSDVNGTFSLMGSINRLTLYIAPGEVLSLRHLQSQNKYEVELDDKHIVLPYKSHKSKLRIFSPDESSIKLRVPGMRVGCNSVKRFCYIKVSDGLHSQVTGLLGNRNFEPADDIGCLKGRTRYATQILPEDLNLICPSSDENSFTLPSIVKSDLQECPNNHSQTQIKNTQTHLSKTKILLTKALRSKKTKEWAKKILKPKALTQNNDKCQELNSLDRKRDGSFTVSDLERVREDLESGKMQLLGRSKTVCNELFAFNMLSELSQCFSVVNPTPFYASCSRSALEEKCSSIHHTNHKEVNYSKVCQSIWAYKTLCRSYDVELDAHIQECEI